MICQKGKLSKFPEFLAVIETRKGLLLRKILLLTSQAWSNSRQTKFAVDPRSLVKHELFSNWLVQSDVTLKIKKPQQAQTQLQEN